MAVRKPRRPAPARKARKRVAASSRARAAKTKTKTKNAARKKAGAARPGSGTPAAVPRPQRQSPENLRLRAVEPSLTVDDLDRSIRFYADVLGFFVAERWTDGTVLRGVMLKAGACQLALTQDDWTKGRHRQKGQGLRLWCRTAQDIDALARRIVAKGGHLTDGPTEQSWGARSLTVADPDGFGLTFYQEA